MTLERIVTYEQVAGSRAVDSFQESSLTSSGVESYGGYQEKRSIDFRGYSERAKSYLKEHIVEINHYSSRILIDSWVPLAGALALTVPALVGLVAVKLSNPKLPAFYLKKIHTSDRTEQWQIKTTTMIPDADSKRDELIAESKLQSGGFKSKNDPRVTKIGKILRKFFGLDEVWQLWQLARHVYSRNGFFYNENKHYHYTVAPRPQTEKTISEIPNKESRKALSKGRTGITGMYQVGAGSEGECAEKFHETFESRWIIPYALSALARTPMALLLGHNG